MKAAASSARMARSDSLDVDQLQQPPSLVRTLEVDRQADTDPVVGGLEDVRAQRLGDLVDDLDHRLDERLPIGLALALPEAVMARPTGVGRAIATYNMPIEGRDEWIAAVERLA
jgi:hypothetical protein